MEAVVWTVDWNPEFAADKGLQREVLQALKAPRVVECIQRFCKLSIEESTDMALESEHLLWLDSQGDRAYFVRVWYEEADEKLFVVIEENELGDVGFLVLNKFDCATYADEAGTEDVPVIEFQDPNDWGVSR